MSIAGPTVQSPHVPQQHPAKPAGAAGRPAAGRRYKPDMLLYMLVLFTWVGIWRVQDLVPILGKIKFPILVELGTVVLFLMDQTPVRRVKWIKSPILTITLVLVGIMILGLPTALWPGIGVSFVTKEFPVTLILMVMLATSMREFSDLEWMAFAHLTGAVIYATYIFLFCPIGYDGRLGNLVFYDANDFALLMVCAMPFAVYFLRPKTAVWRRLFALFALGLFAIMIIKSGSRGGFLGLLTVVVYVLLFYRAIPTRLRLGSVAAGIAVFAVFGSAQYWTIIGTILHPQKDYNMTDETGRSAIWKRGMGYMKTHPILGVGIRNFAQAEGSLSPVARRYAEVGRGIKWSVAHNSFVEVGAECGIAALALFVLRFLIIFRTLARVRAGPRGKPWITESDQAYAQMLFGALAGFVVSGFFVSAEYFVFLYTALGILLGQQAVLKRRARMPRRPVLVQPTQQIRRVPEQPVVQWLPTGS
jgi:O-antigen ligase